MSEEVKKQTAQEELAQIELELKRKELRLKEITLSKAEQESELIVHQVEQFKLDKESKLSIKQGRQTTLDNQLKSRRARQAGCQHRMGGNGLEEMYTATSEFRSVAKFVLTTGDMFVRCTRCRKEWHAPDPLHFLKKPVNRKDFTNEVDYRKAIAKNVDKPAYDAAFAEFRDVCSWNNGGMRVGNFGVQITYQRDGVNISREKTSEMSKGARENAL